MSSGALLQITTVTGNTAEWVVKMDHTLGRAHLIGCLQDQHTHQDIPHWLLYIDKYKYSPNNNNNTFIYIQQPMKYVLMCMQVFQTTNEVGPSKCVIHFNFPLCSVASHRGYLYKLVLKMKQKIKIKQPHIMSFSKAKATTIMAHRNMNNDCKKCKE